VLPSLCFRIWDPSLFGVEVFRCSADAFFFVCGWFLLDSLLFFLKTTFDSFFDWTRLHNAGSSYESFLFVLSPP